MGIRVGPFYWFKNVQEFLSSLVIFNTGQSLPDVSEKNPPVRTGCFFKSPTVTIYFTKDKRTCESPGL